MRTIWKYEIPLRQDITLEMPQGAKILSVQTQGDQPVLWAEVVNTKPMETRYFVLVGTGKHVPTYASKFLGTLQFEGGTYVFHLYEWER